MDQHRHGPEGRPGCVVARRQGEHQQTGQIIGEKRQDEIEDAVEQGSDIWSHGVFSFRGRRPRIL